MEIQSAGDFERLFERYYTLAYSVALRVLRDHHDAEDVAQAVFCKMWSSGDVVALEHIEGWLIVASRNAAIDRTRRRSRELVSIEPIYATAAAGDDPELRAIQSLEYGDMHDALKRLPPAPRQLLIDAFLKGRSHATIASTRKMALGTVKSRIRSGLRMLRGKLKAS
jgi:RNA polymerase sigma-70 factor (ECF subfamily)